MYSKETIKKTVENLASQDNCATDQPIFLVEEEDIVYGVDLDRTSNYIWVDKNNEQASQLEAEALDAHEYKGNDIGGWEKVGYITRWKFVTCCFTHVAAEDYIRQNKHNLTNPRIYVASGYRNNEFIAVRSMLLSLGLELFED